MTLEHKMYSIAKQYNDLNGKGDVKAFKGNEKGYGRIKKIVPGCSLFVIHNLENRLIISLLITPAAKSRYKLACDKSVETFKNHFIDNYGFAVRVGSMGDRYDNHFTDITKKDLPEIFTILEEIRNKLV